MTTVQAIYHTQRTHEWHRFALDLGLRPAFEPGPDWAEFHGGGVLAIQRTDAAAALHGITRLHVLVADLGGVEALLHTTSAAVSRHEMEGVGTVVTARPASGITVSASARPRPARGALRVQPIWSQVDSDEAIGVLRALGLSERIRSEAGTWVDFEGDTGGLAAFHTGMSQPMTLSFEYAGDLDRLAERLSDAGHETSVVDEAYNRSLLVRTPDDWTLWVNGQMTDLYGYRRAD
ncbi:hypothetical protein [Sinomonas humi]|uniref:VOC domain-containing protein n=1 Tax=Sinomonas humi TaxID=1338436 RepID=A0A0B2AKV2_9MICC|nr:hypothetical protein [Sinomonas humi]KHL02421.1 hypothetical protein LK10_12515 [Sinomonas humi]